MMQNVQEKIYIQTKPINTEHINNDIYVNLLAAFFICFSPLHLLMRQLLNYQPLFLASLGINLGSILMYGLLVILVILSVKRILQMLTKVRLLILFTGILIYSFSILLSQYSAEVHLSILSDIILKCIPGFFVASSITNYARFKWYLKVSAYIISITYLILFVVLNYNFFVDSQYSQLQSYLLLPVTIIVFSGLFEKESIIFKILDALFFAFTFIMIVMFGARGPIICIVAYMLAKIISETISNFQKGIILLGITIVVSILIFVYFDQIIVWLTEITERAGFSSRALTKIQGETFFQDVARNNLSAGSLQAISQNPFGGMGLINDRYYLHTTIMPSSDATGTYAHNFFLEVWMQYGVIFGTAFIAIVLSLIFRSVFQKYNKDARDIILIFLAFGFFPLMVSGSYVGSEYFYMLIGFCVGFLFNKRRPTMKSQERIDSG